MTPERWREVERVYHAAQAARPEARAALLAEACSGDDELRREVESLLLQAASSGLLDRGSIALAGGLGSASQQALIGRRLGVFEVQELVGVGGMGEVYRARDTRLGRDVAIKILPPEFKDDRGRVARFEQEARLLASLNHPHIAAIYGLQEGADVTALVMEFVEGDDLSRRERMPVDQTLSIACQIAEALEAAHDQGVIHRDLKPANIKVRPDGTVKVLDFGLATALASAADPNGRRAEPQTLPGVIVGTPAYMSPEQARGDLLSRQTDIWAFGVVLFELLSGVSPFARPTTAGTLASVSSDHADYSRLPDETPPNVRALIRRCLEKDRKRRLQHIGDARLELEDALSQPPADASSDRGPRASRGHPRASTRLLAAVVLVAVAALGLAVGAFVWRQPSPPVVKTIIAADPFFSGTDRSLAFTPDGHRLVYISSDGRQIMVRALDSLEPVAILKTASYIRGLFPSPDGRWFGYVDNSYTLKKVASTGGSPLTVLTMDGPSRGAAWGPDDSIAFASGAPDTGLQRVPSGGGPVTVLTRPDREQGEADHVHPTWLPGGRRLLFTILSERGGLDAAKVAVLDLETGTTRTVLEGAYAARYVEGGHLVYVAAGAVWAVRFDLERLQTHGTPREALRPVSVGALGATAEFDVSSTGALAYARGTTTGLRRVPVWVDRHGRETPLVAPVENYHNPRLSPDGRRLAIGVGGDLYVWQLARPWSSATRVTFTPGIDWYPVWTPDGRRLVFGSWRGGRFSNLYVHDLRTSSTERLTDSPEMQSPTSITPDGTTVIFHSFPKRLEMLRLHGPAQPSILVDTVAEERNGEVSPDGRWLVYEGESTSRPGEYDIYVRPFPDVDRGVWQVTRQGGMFPMWSRDGRALFYVSFEGTMTSVPVEASSTTWKAGSPTELFRGPYGIRGGTYTRMFDVAQDGRFLMLKDQPATGTPSVVIVQNWVAELTRQVR